MLISDVKKLLQREFGTRSLAARVCGWKGWLITSGDMCDLVFVPDIIKRDGGCQVVGVVAIRIPEFEEYFSSNPLSARKTFYLGAHISNFEEFFYPVLINEEPDIKASVDRIHSGIRKACHSIPLDLDDLRKDISSGKVGKYNLDTFWAADGKTQALLDWLQPH